MLSILPCPLQVPSPAVTLLDSTERLIRSGFVPSNDSQPSILVDDNIGEKKQISYIDSTYRMLGFSVKIFSLFHKWTKGFCRITGFN